jgi:histidyl-tRNA synthetase
MAKRPKFQRPTGMHDILPGEQKYFQKIFDTAKNIVEFYGFQKIDTPIVEQMELFSRGIGIATDIVEKEMYTLRTKGGDFLALRPEGTAPIVRAYIENGMFNLPSPIKLWYFGPYFRHERPQSGRFRQFHHLGVEVFKEKSPVIDARVIQIFYNILKELKLKNLVIKINSIGDSQCRPYYRKLLVSYLRSRESLFCVDCRKRIRKNPLRVLDCKQEKCREIISQAPQLINHLCDECHTHLKSVLEFLDEVGLPYNLDPYLVRGLDYYTKTVFEIVKEQEDIAGQEQKKESLSLVGGGRYDGLVKLLGGRETPACGAAAGVELGDAAKKKCLKLFEDFRKAKIPVNESFSRDSLNTQLKIADKLGVSYTLILGHKEVLDGTIIIREMKRGKQETVKIEKVVAAMKRKVKKS